MDFARQAIVEVLRRISPKWLAAFALWRADRNELATRWWLGLRRAVRRDQQERL